MACGTGKTFTSLRIAEELAAAGRPGAVPGAVHLAAVAVAEGVVDRGRAAAAHLRGLLRHQGRQADRSGCDRGHPRRRPRAARDHRSRRGCTPGSGRGSRRGQAHGGVLHLPVHRRRRPGAAAGVCRFRPGHLRRGAPHHRRHAGGRGRVRVRPCARQQLPARRQAPLHDRDPAHLRRHAKAKAGQANAVLASMDDESVFGPEFHRLGFGEAVEQGTADRLQGPGPGRRRGAGRRAPSRLQLADDNSELQPGRRAKIVGCWNGLAKRQRLRARTSAPTTTPDDAGRRLRRGPSRTRKKFAATVQRRRRGLHRRARCLR